MKIFKITEKIEVVCKSERTRSGFRHLATLCFNGVEQENAKCCYQNRTWERYEFQSVLSNLVEKSKGLTDAEKKTCKEFIDRDQTDWSQLKSVAMVAKLGEVFCDNQKDQNNWKKRMIKAGLGNQGLSIPEDWDTLSEDEKQKRLDKVIALSSNPTGGSK